MWHFLAAGFGAASAVIGLLASLLTFLPSVSTDALYIPDDNVPLSARFAIRNVSPIVIRDVTCGCVFVAVDGNQLQASAPDGSGRIGVVRALTTGQPMIAPALGSQQAATTDCNMVRSGTTSHSTRYDLILVVSYKPSWIPLRRTAMFRFSNDADRNGQQHWFPRPITPDVLRAVPKDWGGLSETEAFRLDRDLPLRPTR
jgi:hypothetical protein